MLSFTYFFYMEVHFVDSAIKISPSMKLTLSKDQAKVLFMNHKLENSSVTKTPFKAVIQSSAV